MWPGMKCCGLMDGMSVPEPLDHLVVGVPIRAGLPLDCWRLTGLHASRWNCWHLVYFGILILQRKRWCGALLQCWRFTFLRCTVADIMNTSANGSPIQTYMDSCHSMCVSHDADRLDPKDF